MKKISTLAIAMFALFASQSIQAKNNQPTQVAEATVYDDDTEIEKRYKKEPDPEFKFEEEEVTVDLAQEGPYVLPKLLNPNKLVVENYGVSHSELINVDEKGNFTVTGMGLGDVTIYAKGKRNAKFAETEAQCIVHIVNSNLLSNINFGNDVSLNREGDGGWSDSAGLWALTQSSWWIAGEYNWNMNGYTEAYLVSPVFNLNEYTGYQVEFTHTCYYKEGFQETTQLVVHEVGGEWIPIEGIAFPEPMSYAKVKSGKLDVPNELIGKPVEFAFKYIGEHSSNDSNWNVESFSLLKNGENIPTGINNIETNKTDNKIYDLQGRLVKNPAKGLYIMNGKKVIIK